MNRKIIASLAVACLLAVVSTSMAGCADDSMPNRRGIERAPLTGNSGTNNAYNRENEAPKRDLPTGGEKEFPGQSKAPSNVLPGDQPVVYLSEVSSDAAIKPAQATTAPATSEPAVAATPVAAPVVPTYSAKTKRVNDNGAVATPGTDIIVPGTDEAIPPTWGNPVVIDNLPHRDWPKSVLNYSDGVVYHNPYYFRELFDHGNQASGTSLGTSAGYAKDWLEIPWFYAEIVALPGYMVYQRPLSQQSSRTNAPEALYNGKVSESGPIVPSPTPGKVEFVYPSTTLPSENK